MSARIRFRPRITKKNMCFFCPARALDCCRFSEKKQSISKDKKNISKKTSLFREIKNIFPAIFFLLIFSSPSLFFFLNRSHFFFILSPSLTFPNIWPICFIWSPSLTFPKICSMFFFLKISHYILIFFWSKTEILNKVALPVIWIFTHLKMCFASATRNFKWVVINHICSMRNQTFANLDAKVGILPGWRLFN